MKTLMAMRADGRANLLVVPGSMTQDTCSQCGQKVWISPSTAKWMKTEEMRIVCDICLDIRNVGVFTISPEQLKEAEEFIAGWQRRN